MKKDIFEEYVDKVTDRFGVSREQLFTKDKSRHIADARHMLYYLCKSRPMSMTYIKQYMGENGYDIAPSNILHGVRKVEDNINTDPDYTILINQLK
jgi:chromosomal replication initiation ATPase DnaA